VVSEAAKQAELGLVPFFALLGAGGLGALVMPSSGDGADTVNFFVKQGQQKGGRQGWLIAYCLAIIGVSRRSAALLVLLLGHACNLPTNRG